MLRTVALVVGLSLSLAGSAAAQVSHSGPGVLGTRSIGEIQIELHATGGDGNYEWEHVPGFGTGLPPGVAVRPRADAPSWFNVNADFGLIGIATMPGDYSFRLRVRSGGQEADRDYSLTISPVIISEDWELPNAFVGQPFSYQLHAAAMAPTTLGGLTWGIQSVNPSAPAWVGVGPTTGLLSGTPTASGFYNIHVTLLDSGTGHTVSRNVSVRVHDVRIVTPGALPNATQDSAYSTSITADGGTPPYLFTASRLPNGLTLDPANGLLASPNIGTGGPLTFDVTVTDAAARSVTKRMALAIAGVPPQLPGVRGGFSDDCTFGVPCSRTIGVLFGAAPFTWDVSWAHSAQPGVRFSGLPDGMWFRFGSDQTGRFVNPGSVELNGTPTIAGDFILTLTVTDGLGNAATRSFPMTVSRLMQQHDWGFVPGTRGSLYSDRVWVIGGTGPWSITNVEGALAAGINFDPLTFTAAGTPIENGFFTIGLTVADSAGNTLRIRPGHSINSPPPATLQMSMGPDLGTITTGSSYSRTFQACCVSSPVTWSIVGGAPPAGLFMSSDGILSGTPTQSGTFTFLVRAVDSSNAANDTIQQFRLVANPLTITGSLTLPTGNVNVAYGPGGAGVTLTVSGGTGPYTWSAPQGGLPAGLTVGAGVISGTPQQNGTFQFNLAVTEAGTGHVQIRTFTLAVYPEGVTPPLNFTAGGTTTLQVGQVTIPLTPSGGTAPYTFAVVGPPVAGMHLYNGQPLPTSFAPSQTAGYLGVITEPGTYTTTIRLTDAASNTFDRNVTIRVAAHAILSQTNLPRARINTFYSFTFAKYPDVGTYQWVGSNLPPGMTLDETTGTLSGTPTAAGTFNAQIILRDLNLTFPFNQVSVGYTLVVEPFTIATGGILPQGTVGVSYGSVALSAIGCIGTCTWSIGPGPGSLPGGLSLSSEGVISGTPTGATTNALTITVTGSNGSAAKRFSIQIVASAPQPLTIVTSSFSDTTAGNGYSAQLTALGGTPPYTWSVEPALGELPEGLSLHHPGEAYSSQFGAGMTHLAGRALEAGVHPFTLKVTDAANNTATRAFTLNVSALQYHYTNLPVPGRTLVYGQPLAPAQPLLVTGGSGSYTSWTHLTPMPGGLALDPGTGVVSGTPLDTGSLGTQIRVTDSTGNSIQQQTNFTIAGPTGTLLSFSIGSTLGSVPQGSFFSRSFNVSGGTPPYTVTAVTAMPPGLELLTGDELLSGGPTLATISGNPLFSGMRTFTLQATDSAGNVGARTFTIVVAPFAFLSQTQAVDGSVGGGYSHPLLTTSGVTWSLAPGSSLPPGVTLSGAALGGTPAQAGNYSFTLEATHGGTAVSFTFNLRVSSIKLTVNGSEDQILPAAIVSAPYTQALTATGAAGPLTWSATGLPSGITLSTAGVLSGTTTQVGTFLVVVTVNDGVVPLQRRFTLFVRRPNPDLMSFPMLQTALPDAAIGQGVSFNLAAVSGGRPPYVWCAQAGDCDPLPAGLALVSGAQLPATLPPGSTLLAGAVQAAGLYTFDLTARDSTGLASVRRTFTLKVSPINILAGTLRTAVSGTAYAQQLTASGGTGPYTFSMSPGNNTAQDMVPAEFTLSSSGLLSGNTSSTGNYQFRLHVLDTATGETFTRFFGLTVNNSFGLRVANNNLAATTAGSGRAQTLTTSGTSTYTWTSVGSLPAGMQLVTIGPNQTLIVGQPQTVGTHTYMLRATDNANPANVADRVFTLRVGPRQIVSPALEHQSGVGDLPAAQAGVFYSHQVKLAGGTAPFSVLESPLSPLPPGLNVAADGTISGMPGQTGGYAFNLRVRADNGASEVLSPALFLTVTGGAAPPLTAVSFILNDASVGVPYTSALNRLVRGGTQPYTFSASGLPTGLSVMSGGFGVPPFIGGVTDATPGTYAVTIDVTDSGGQTLSIPVSIAVTGLVLSPDVPLTGVVGQPYAVTLLAAGGASPYTIALANGSDLPPGVTFANGVISGTPTHPGHFLVTVLVADSAGATLTKQHRVTIDNAAGEAPALGLSPKPIVVSYVQGYPAATRDVTLGATSGSLPVNVAAAGIPGVSLSSNAGTAPGAPVTLTFPTGLAAGTYTGVLGAISANATNGFDVTPISFTVAPQPPCTYSLSPTGRSVPSDPDTPPGSGVGSFDVQTHPFCAWTAVSSASWLDVTSSPNGTGPGVVSYKVKAKNNDPAERTATISVGGALFTITQFGDTSCTYVVTPTSATAAAANNPSLTISVMPSPACGPWTASGLSATPASGSGAGTVTLTIPDNTGSAASRVLTATVAGHTITVNQAGAACTVSLAPYTESFDAGGSGIPDPSFAVTTPAGCPFAPVAGPAWIDVLSLPGETPVRYKVHSNPTTIGRSGTIDVGGQSFVVSQNGRPCDPATVNTSALGSPYGVNGGSGSLSITTDGPNCSWTASGPPWATLSSSSGTGNATLFVSVTTNAASTTQRTANLIVDGQTISIAQSGTTCTFSLQSESSNVPASGGSGSIGVVAPGPCAWSALSPPGDTWVSVQPSDGSGTSNVQFTVQPNPAGVERTATLTIAGVLHTLTQAAAPCSYTLGATGVTIGPGSTGASFTYSTAAGCSTNAVAYAGWLTDVTTTAGTVTFTVQANPLNASRSAVIQLGDRLFSVTQTAGCGFSLNSYGALFAQAGGSGNVFGSQGALGCTPVIGTSQPSIVTLGTLTGPLFDIYTQPFTVAPFSSLNPLIRKATITFGGQIFTIKQTSW